MSYVLHPAARTSARSYFKDLNFSLLYSTNAKLAHLFTFVGATIPFYMFSSAYHAAKTNGMKAVRLTFCLPFLNRRDLVSNAPFDHICPLIRTHNDSKYSNTQMLWLLPLVRA